MSSIPVSRSITLASQFNRYAPLTLNSSNDPALSNADWVRQFILSPPFGWRWNRQALAPITMTPGNTDYAISVPNFGWIEKAQLSFPVSQDTGDGLAVELEVTMVLARETVSNQPTKICALLDNGAGTITFRVMPPPDRPYQLELLIQNSAPTFAATTDTWAPIPDYLSYLYNSGMEAKAYEYIGDERFLATMTTFMRQVISANQGLDETQTNIFLADKLNTMREQQAVLGNSQSGRIGRGALQG